MRTRASRTGTRRPGVRRTLAAAAAFATCAGTVAAVVPAADAAPSARRHADAPSDVTMVQANIYTRLSVPRFQADVREVLAQRPDFVTYNEVPFRNDAVMAPAGYDLYRGMRDRFTKATPVAWRTDRWNAIDQGTFMISNHRGKPPGRVVELGRRSANWVTLQGDDGRVLSVVSVHVAPLVRGMPDLLRPSVTRLGRLVDQLAPRGPVLVGGDFNVHYKSGRYPRDILSAHDLVPTYDTMRRYFPTGDHHQATIDYVFDRGANLLTADHQYPVELNSDHDAVVAGFTWQTDAPATVQTIRNDPSGDRASRRAVVTSVAEGIRSAAPGSTLAVATNRFELVAIVRPLKRALTRGVHVRVVTADARRSVRERRLARAIAARGDAGSWMHRCVNRCRPAWTRARVPRGFLLLGRPDGGWATRYDTNRSFTGALLDRVSKVRIQTGQEALDRGAKLFRAID